MRQRRIVLTKPVAQRAERLLRLALARNDSKSPVHYFVAAGKPFVRPGKQNRPGQSALGHAFDVPAQHFRLFVLRVANRVHSELAQDERTLAGQILQEQKVALEIEMIVEINIKTEKIDILRQ